MTVELIFKCDWLPVSTRKGDYLYPWPRDVLSASQYERPAVYRWVLAAGGQRPRFLVGETDSLYRRIGEYLGNKGPYHVKIRDCFEKHRQRGGSVQLETVHFEPFSINSILVSEERLMDPFVRKFLENLCCAMLRRDGFEVLNPGPEEKLLRAVRKLPPDEQAKFISELKRRAASGL